MGRGFGAWTPNVDISHQDGALFVHADLPGLRKEDIVVEIDHGHLVIRGERRSRHEGTEQGSKRVECSYGSFTRVIPLPGDVDVDRVEASVADSVLQVKLPAPSLRQGSHRIEVRTRDAWQERQSAESAAGVADTRSAERNSPQQQCSAV